MRAPALLLAAALVGCAASPEAPPAAPTAPAGPTAPAAPTAAAAPAPAAPALDLSTAEKARVTIHDALRRGDKEAFRRCVSKRILARQSGGFDAWYGVWKAAAERGGPEVFKGIVVTQEDGQFKLDEN